MSSEQRIRQMTSNERAIANVIGGFPTYMRPPYSNCTIACQADMQHLAYHRVYFDLDTQDYLNPKPDQIQNAKDIVSRYFDSPEAFRERNALSIQHDIHEQSAGNLTDYILDLNGIAEKGLKFVTVGECMGDAKQNWYRHYKDRIGS